MLFFCVVITGDCIGIWFKNAQLVLAYMNKKRSRSRYFNKIDKTHNKEHICSGYS